MPAWGPLVAIAAKLAMGPVGRKVARQAAAALAGALGTAGAGGLGRAQSARGQRALADKLARQVHGQLSDAVFIGSAQEHWVVWKAGVPIAAFPPVQGDLLDRSELAHVTDADRFDPPAPKPHGEKNSIRDRLPRPPRRKKGSGG